MENLNKTFSKGNILTASELNDIVSKINELIGKINISNGRSYVTLQDVNDFLGSITEGEVIIPVKSEFGDSLVNAISQRFFTEKYEELKNRATKIASFGVVDGCLVMDEIGDSNFDFGINDSGNLILDIYGTD